MSDSGFVDKEALQALLERVSNAIRPLGLTVEQAGFGVDPEAGVYLQMMASVRDSAINAVQENEEEKATFNQMMAEDHRRTIERQKDEFLSAIGDVEALEAALFGDEDECAHGNQHEGLCLDCGKEME